MGLRIALLAGAGLAIAGGAFAQAPGGPINGPYVQLGVGYNYLDQFKVATSPVTFPDPTTGAGDTVLGSRQNTKASSGFTGELGPGWGFGNGLRIQLDATYLLNDVTGKSNGGTAAGGTVLGSTRVQQIGALVNLSYDFVDLLGPGITPFIGGGAGFLNVEQQHFRYSGTYTPLLTLGTAATPSTPYSFGASDSATVFAYEAVAGVRFSLASINPGLSLFAQYRFLGTSNSGRFSGNFSAGGNDIIANYKSGQEYNHAGMIGLMYAFGAPPPPPPPPPPAPPPAPVQEARTYLVFFDWDRADLTERARQIVSEAAQASQHVTTTRIEVNGYTDLSGTAAYNLKLSVRRAKSVQAELIRDGVPAGEIEIHGYGESNPLVPTAKGVREPQNRRVEIILH